MWYWWSKHSQQLHLQWDRVLPNICRAVQLHSCGECTGWLVSPIHQRGGLPAFRLSLISNLQSHFWSCQVNDISYGFLVTKIPFSYSRSINTDFFLSAFSEHPPQKSASVKASVKHWNRSFWHHQFSFSWPDYVLWCELCGAAWE